MDFNIFYITVNGIAVLVILLITFFYVRNWVYTPVGRWHIYFSLAMALFVTNELVRSYYSIYRHLDRIEGILRIMSGTSTALMAVSMFTAGLYYLGKDKYAKTVYCKCLQIGFPLIYTLFMLTDRWHHQYIHISQDGIAHIAWGIILFQTVAYALLISAVVFYMKRMFSNVKAKNRFILRMVVIIGVGVPFAAGIFNIIFILVYDFMPLAFCFYVVVSYIYSVKFRYFNVLPSALTAVFEGMDSYLILGDDKGNILFANRKGREVLATHSREILIGLINDGLKMDFNQDFIAEGPALGKEYVRITRRRLNDFNGAVLIICTDLIEYKMLLLKLENQKEILSGLYEQLRHEHAQIKESQEAILQDDVLKERQKILSAVSSEITDAANVLLENTQKALELYPNDIDDICRLMEINIDKSYNTLQNVRAIVRNLQQHEV